MVYQFTEPRPQSREAAARRDPGRARRRRLRRRLRSDISAHHGRRSG